MRKRFVIPILLVLPLLAVAGYAAGAPVRAGQSQGCDGGIP